MSAIFKPFFVKSIRTVNKSPSVGCRSRLSYSSQLQKFVKNLDWLFQKRKSTVFISLKNLITVQLSYSDIKKVQQLILSLQKKTFTNKLWGFYRLKNFKDCYSGGSTLFSHISSPRVRTISTERDNLKSSRFTENKLSVFYKLMLVLNKPVQMTMLKTFWMIYLYRKPAKKSGFFSYQANKSGNLSTAGGMNGSINYNMSEISVKPRIENGERKSQNEIYCKAERSRRALWMGNDVKTSKWKRGGETFKRIMDKRKLWAFDGIKKTSRRTKGFLQYLVSKESVCGVKTLENIFKYKKQAYLKYSINCIRSLKRRIVSSKSVYQLQGALHNILKKKAFKSIFTYGAVKKVLQKVNLLTYYLKLFSQKSKQFGFFKIKAYIKYKNFVLKKFTETLHKVNLLSKAVIFLQIRRFSKELMPYCSKVNPIPRVGSKLTTLPTIFLEGDPSYNEPEEFSFSTTNKRRTLFKF